MKARSSPRIPKRRADRPTDRFLRASIPRLSVVTADFIVLPMNPTTLDSAFEQVAERVARFKRNHATNNFPSEVLFSR
jgi:hypothetical protein